MAQLAVEVATVTVEGGGECVRFHCAGLRLNVYSPDALDVTDWVAAFTGAPPPMIAGPTRLSIEGELSDGHNCDNEGLSDARRLAWAVLDDDAAAALVLADKVLMEHSGAETTLAAVQRAVAKAVRKEREACAEALEAAWRDDGHTHDLSAWTAAANLVRGRK